MSESGFEGKAYVITGAARGMGAETAKLLASRGANVSICDVRDDDLTQVKTAIEKLNRGQVMTTRVDVRDENQVNEWIAASVAEFGKLDGAVNVAGVLGKDTMHKTTDQISTEDWRFVFDVNVTGMMFALRAAIPHLKEGGSIVNFASTSGQMGHAMNGAYCASKHAVIGLSRCVAKELGPKGITVNVLSP
jgi:NAD(P)-dependent dehydrogenase (short-subunit alcohol dehydrogenase family)